VDAVELCAAADDGPRPLFLRSGESAYTIGRYLDDVDKRYGGIDASGCGTRIRILGSTAAANTICFANLPGGTLGRETDGGRFSPARRARDVPVIVVGPWNACEDTPDADALTRELAAVGADGINGDTLDGMPRSFREASDKIGHPLALEPEDGPASDEMVAYNNLSWDTGTTISHHR